MSGTPGCYVNTVAHDESITSTQRCANPTAAFNIHPQSFWDGVIECLLRPGRKYDRRNELLCRVILFPGRRRTIEQVALVGTHRPESKPVKVVGMLE
jgi:hypothetical protein